ncbi:MAG: hypothetical protein LC679_08255 [Intrasporangiaceae bacterium]|nr:hypothetical protein [Intrasporangiaceae bacterium]
MCSKATCRACGKTTWSGCGQHVQQVMGGVPRNQQCVCTDADRAAARDAARSGAWYSRMFSR